jgi:hypothetical protein
MEEENKKRADGGVARPQKRSVLREPVAKKKIRLNPGEYYDKDTDTIWAGQRKQNVV